MSTSGTVHDFLGKRLAIATAICLAAILTASAARAEVVARYAFTNDASNWVTGGTDGALMSGASVSGGSLHLDGIDDYVDLSSSSFAASILGPLSGTSSFELWVTWNGTGSLNQQIFDFGNGLQKVELDPTNNPGVFTWVPANHMYLSANAGTAGSGVVRYALDPVASGNNAMLNAPGPLSNYTQPTHIVVTYNPGRGDLATKTLYINGVQVDRHSPSSPGSPFPGSYGGAIYSFLGKDQGGDPLAIPPPDVPAAVFFGGTIVDFRVWNNELSAAEVAAHYSNPAGPDALAVWSNTSAGNFNDPTKWDTGTVPGANTTIFLNDLSGMHLLDLNGGTRTVNGVTLINGTIQDTAATKGTLTSTAGYDVRSGTISANLAGTGGLTKTTANLVTLSGTNTFTGPVTINAGYMQLGTYGAAANSALGSSANTVTLNNDGTSLDLIDSSITVSQLTVAGGTPGQGPLITTSSGSNAAITSTGTFELQNGSIGVGLGGTAALPTGTVRLNKTTTGTVVLNKNNTYTRGTLVAAGTLDVGPSSNLGANIAGNNVTVNDGAILILRSADGLGSNQDLFVQSGGMVAAAFAFNQSQLIAKLGNSGEGVIAMSFDNPNALNFYGVDSPAYLGARDGTYIYSGTLTPKQDVKNVSTNDTYRLGGGGGTLIMATNLVDLPSGGTPSPRTRAVRIAGGGSPGKVVLQGAGNTYSGGTTIYNGGTLEVASTSILGANAVGNNVTVQGGGLLVVTSAGNIGNNQQLQLDGGGVAGLSGFALTQSFADRPSASSMGIIGIDQDPATDIVMHSPVSIGAYSNASPPVGTTLTKNITPYNNTYRFGSGNAALTVQQDLADGTEVRSLVMSGGLTPPSPGIGIILAPLTANTYTGGTTVNGGTIQFLGALSLPTTGTLTVNRGTANLGGSNAFGVDRLVVAGTASSTYNADGTYNSTTSDGNVSNGTIYTILDDVDLRGGGISAVIADLPDNPYTPDPDPAIRSVNKTTTATAVLSGANTFTGKVHVYEGTLQVTQDAAFGAVPSTVVPDSIILENGTTLKKSQFDLNANRGITIHGTVTFDAYNGSSINRFQSPITGDGTLIKVGQCPLGISGDDTLATMYNTYTGDTIVREGSFRLRGGNALPFGPGKGNLIVDGDSVPARPGSMDIMRDTQMNGLYGSGAITRFSNTNSEIVDITLGNGDADGNYSGVMGGASYNAWMSLTKVGTGTQVFSRDQQYSDNTTVMGGILDMMNINTPNATVSVQGGELKAASIIANTLTVGVGGVVTIKPLSGGPLAGLQTLSPVPEPATWAMLVLAAMGAGIYWRRRS